MIGEQFTVERIEQKNGDFFLIVLVVLLVGLGIATLFSASYHYGERIFGDSHYFLQRQLLFAVLGIMAGLLLARIPLHWIIYGVPFLLLVTFLLLLATFIPGLSQEIMGARRWIIVGNISFQPSELAKITLIIYLAFIFSKKKDRIGDFVNSVLPPLIITTLFTIMIYLQNDYSTALFVLVSALFIFFIAGVKVWHLFFIIIGAVPLSFLMLFAKDHRVRRIIAYVDPSRDPSGSGYQVLAARSALSDGGLWGSGLGQGTRKLGGIPEAHSDFIFAVLGEEAGFIGILFVILLFIALACRGYNLALHYRNKDTFSYYLSFGLTTFILYQTLVNMAVVGGILPATGLPLPFFSHGGSAMLVTFMMCGLLVNLSRGIKDIGSLDYE